MFAFFHRRRARARPPFATDSSVGGSAEWGPHWGPIGADVPLRNRRRSGLRGRLLERVEQRLAIYLPPPPCGARARDGCAKNDSERLTLLNVLVENVDELIAVGASVLVPEALKKARK